MFAFTFYHHDSMNKTVVSGHKYAVEANDGYTVVSVFPAPGEDGECYYLDNKEFHDNLLASGRAEEGFSRSSYRAAFVSNAEGKTIDHLHPPQWSKPQAAPRAQGITAEMAARG